MITGRKRASGAMLRASATERLIGCSMKSVAAHSLLQRRLGLHRAPQVEHRLDVLVLLVAVEGDVQRPGDAVEDAGDAHQPLEVGAAVAADLELEAALAVGRDDFGERLGQAVLDARAGRLVGGRDRVDQADGVARLDARRRPQAGEEGGEVEARRGRE